MIEERKLKRPALVRVSDPGEMEREIYPAECQLYWMHAKELFAAAIGVSVKTLRNWEQRPGSSYS
jgi:hypothetical protein